jgi:CheY-like chemotaxis protein
MAVRTILIVEDDADLRRLFRTALVLEGYQVQEAENGFSALRLLDGISPPSLILLDLQLPIVSGDVVKQELAGQAHLRHIPVVIVTAVPGSHEHLEAACVLHKPITPEQLVRTVRSCLAAGAPSAT